MRKAKTIKIREDVRIPGTDIILEKGDRIEVLTEDENSMKVFKRGFYVVGLSEESDDIFYVTYDGDVSESEVQYSYETNGLSTKKVPPKAFLKIVLNASVGHTMIYTYLGDQDSNIGKQLLDAITIYDYT